ncbi:MAG TPA: hypothetical protein VE175_09165, partial [Woeseiaceae bacterium]|nr:hypothetical protein [Woeseiaceae bacterium]
MFRYLRKTLGLLAAIGCVACQNTDDGTTAPSSVTGRKDAAEQASGPPSSAAERHDAPQQASGPPSSAAER